MGREQRETFGFASKPTQLSQNARCSQVQRCIYIKYPWRGEGVEHSIRPAGNVGSYKMIFPKKPKRAQSPGPQCPPGPSAVHTLCGHASPSVPLLGHLAPVTLCVSPPLPGSHGPEGHTFPFLMLLTLSLCGVCAQLSLKFWMPIHGDTGAHPQCSSLLSKFMNIPQPAGAL